MNALFLDRDGTLIEDKGYEHKINTLKMLPGVIDGLKILKDHYKFFIITNQTGIGKGIFSEKDFHTFNDHFLEQLKREGIKIEKTCFCPHLDSDACNCKKPKTGIIDELLKEYDVDLNKSWTIGDHPCDVELGINAGCKSAYLFTGHGPKHYKELEKKGIKPTIVANSFLSAANYMLFN